MPTPSTGSIGKTVKLTTWTLVYPAGQPNRVGIVLGSSTRVNGLSVYRVFFGQGQTALFPSSNLIVLPPEIDE